MTTRVVTCRFDAADHRYYLDGSLVPSITQCLERAGWVDSTWMTEHSAARGTEIHLATARYDLGALQIEDYTGAHRGYLLAHVSAMTMLRPEILAVEEPHVHPALRFGGRVDRIVRIHGVLGVLEGKSGQAAPLRRVNGSHETTAHALQLALQAILVAPIYHLPPEAVARWVLYWRRNGTFRLQTPLDGRDFDLAYRIIQQANDRQRWQE